VAPVDEIEFPIEPEVLIRLEVLIELEVLIGPLTVVGLLALLARLIGVPYPSFLVLGGFGLGFVPALPDTELPRK
jgi:hypothetical protein